MKTILIGLVLASIPLDAEGALFATQPGTSSPGVYTFSPDGTPSRVIAAPSPMAIAWSATTGDLYFAEGQGDQVWRMNIDGTDVQSLGTFAAHPSTVAVDDLHGHLYIGGNSNVGLRRGSLTGVGTVYLGNYSSLSLLPVPALDRVYFGTTSGVSYYDTFWGGTANIYSFSTQIYGLAIDTLTDLLYWTEISGRVMRSHLDGSGVEVYSQIADTPLSIAGSESPYGLAIDQASRTMYVSFPKNGQILAYDLNQTDGGTAPTVFASGLEYPYGLAFVPVPEPSATVLLITACIIARLHRRR